MQPESSIQTLLFPATRVYGFGEESSRIKLSVVQRHKPLAGDCSMLQVSVEGPGWLSGCNISMDQVDLQGLFEDGIWFPVRKALFATTLLRFLC